ncbi:MAG: cobyrinate a,c-diamide synthase [Eubacteriales bacterium]
MKKIKVPRILFAAPSSGSGKTTITCGIIRALTNRGISVSSFKCGPDYIDPMFHKKALGVDSRNLDLFFNDENTVKHLLAKNAANTDISIIEGVMGYYDGLAGKDYKASSYDVSKTTNTPTILILDCKGKSVSILAEIYGFLKLEKDSNIKGVILNRISPMIFSEIKDLIEKRLGICVIGYVPMLKREYALESRHLGLVIADEVENIDEILDFLSTELEKTVNINLLIELANSASEIEFEPVVIKRGEPFRIAVAMDKAFCFYYQDNLDLLSDMGAEICYFSPLNDQKLPENISALYLGGGYPELYLPQLSKNSVLMLQIAEKLEAGLPCIAECGGFMYLHENLQDKEHNKYKMVGFIKGESVYAGKLVRFGYIDMTAKTESIFGEAGIELKGHEFHYWDSTNNGNSFLAQKPLRKTAWECVVGNNHLYAGYPHLHFYSNISAVERFVKICQKYSKTVK